MCGWREVRHRSLGTHKISPRVVYAPHLCPVQEQTTGQVAERQGGRLADHSFLGDWTWEHRVGDPFSQEPLRPGLYLSRHQPLLPTCSALTGRDWRPCLSGTPFSRSGGGARSCPHLQSGEERRDSDLQEPRAPSHAGPWDSHSLSGQLPLGPARWPWLCPRGLPSERTHAQLRTSPFLSSHGSSDVSLTRGLSSQFSPPPFTQAGHTDWGQ